MTISDIFKKIEGQVWSILKAMTKNKNYNYQEAKFEIKFTNLSP